MLNDFIKIEPISLKILSKKWNKEIYSILENSKKYFNKDEFYNNGSLDLGELSHELQVKIEILYFVCGINEIIENLNLILYDLHVLSKTPYYFNGSPYNRFYLLLRTFFYEFFRVKEKHKQILERLKNRDYITKDEMSGINKYLYKLFEETFKLRNNLVHNEVIWKEKHTELQLLYASIESGHMLIKEDNKEEITYEKILPELIEHYFNIFVQQVTLAKKYIEILVKEIVKSVNQKHKISVGYFEKS